MRNNMKDKFSLIVAMCLILGTLLACHDYYGPRHPNRLDDGRHHHSH